MTDVFIVDIVTLGVTVSCIHPSIKPLLFEAYCMIQYCGFITCQLMDNKHIITYRFTISMIKSIIINVIIYYLTGHRRER